MTLEQAAERLGGCSVKTVRRRIGAGELRASRIGRGLWEITEEDLATYLNAVATRPREVRPVPASQPVRVGAPRRRRSAHVAGGLSALVKDLNGGG